MVIRWLLITYLYCCYPYHSIVAAAGYISSALLPFVFFLCVIARTFNLAIGLFHWWRDETGSREEKSNIGGDEMG